MLEEPSSQDLLMDLMEKLVQAETLNQLLQCHHELGNVLQDALNKNYALNQITAIVQGVHDTLLKKAIVFAIEQLKQEGFSEPPAPYAWLVMGSGARGEQTLWTDQDNALVYELNGTEEWQQEVKTYFAHFAETVVQHLAQIGYPMCPGYVMATNPRWRGSIQEFQKRLDQYISYPDWANVRFLLIAADLRPVAGTFSLGYQLRDLVVDKIAQSDFLLWMAADHGLSQKVALSLFHRIQPQIEGDHKGEMNLKEGLHTQLVSSIRLWALAHRISSPSSFSRIQKLIELEVWTKDRALVIQEALETSLTFRLQYPSGYVTINDMNREEYDRLLRALREARSLQTFTAKHFVKPGG